jgi:hypothetical protein
LPSKIVAKLVLVIELSAVSCVLFKLVLREREREREAKVVMPNILNSFFFIYVIIYFIFFFFDKSGYKIDEI